MKTVTSDYVTKYIEYLIEEIKEPVRIEGENRKAVVMMKAEDFENFFLYHAEKQRTSRGNKSAASIFGMLRHRAKAVPVSIEEMESLIKKRRYQRAVQ